ncbi:MULTISPECIES: cytochrome c oxidase subunit II [unclassified Haladaptatus]|uniref:cytochrome c oxidase subunit II n=1 Tax=unclassified Haladaptatus TaxID=2622732 RepID=UPI0023E89E2F|nr:MULTISPECIES: cytochrome c oxidase subunit II [unclassified Haladaptatus]
MNYKRVGFGTLLSVALLAFVVEPVAAQEATSVTKGLIDGLNSKLLYVAIPITILTEGILIYAVLKFRKSDEAKPTQENRRLEITWTVATAIILLFVGVASYQVLGNEFVTAPEDAAENIEEENAVVVEVTAQKYFWTFHYPQHGVNASDTMVIPSDRPVYLKITSTDWLHAFHVPELGLKQDAFPGETHTIKTKVNPSGEGTYQLYCAEYCGVGHSAMLGEVNVTDGETYDAWIQQQQQSAEEAPAGNNNTTSGGNNTTAGGNNTTAASNNSTAKLAA